MTVERCVSCKRPRPTVAESGMRSLVQLIHARAVAASGRLAVFQRSLQPAAANHVARGQPRRARSVEGRTSFHFSATSTRASGTRIPTLAARGQLRTLARGASALPSIRFISRHCDVFQPGFLSGVSREQRRAHTPPAATVRQRLQPDWRCLDFQALSSKTARTVARDGREPGFAVHSVRSWADQGID